MRAPLDSAVAVAAHPMVLRELVATSCKGCPPLHAAPQGCSNETPSSHHCFSSCSPQRRGRRAIPWRSTLPSALTAQRPGCVLHSEETGAGWPDQRMPRCILVASRQASWLPGCQISVPGPNNHPSRQKETRGETCCMPHSPTKSIPRTTRNPPPPPPPPLTADHHAPGLLPAAEVQQCGGDVFVLAVGFGGQ